MKFTLTRIILFSAIVISTGSCSKTSEKPNILWLTCEDISPYLGCYGDSNATTPNLDRFAKESILYVNAFANAPVCAPARSTIITGCYANSLGTQNMFDGKYTIPDEVRLFPEFLKKAGYYCTNNSKTNYNCFRQDDSNFVFSWDWDKYAKLLEGVWDESSDDAHYKNRKEGQPFFAIFNSTVTHESSLHISINRYNLMHRPEDMEIAPYLPDTKEMRHDYAQMYDQITLMDAWFQSKLDELERAGLAENTIVFFYSDHGGIVPRGKRFIYESGTRVPMLVHFPKKYRHLAPQKMGTRSDRVVSFVDLAPTVLNLAGIPLPDYLQGKPFLGKNLPKEPQYAFLFRDRIAETGNKCRAVRDKDFEYIRNYTPFKIDDQPNVFYRKAPSVISWERAYHAGECNEIQSRVFRPKPPEELYYIKTDPYEINNLANDPNYKDVIDRMSKACDNWMLDIDDSGLMPMILRDYVIHDKSTTVRDFCRSEKFDTEKLLSAANFSNKVTVSEIDQIEELLNDENPILRYWGLVAMINLKSEGSEHLSLMEAALKDPVYPIRILAAYAVLNIKENKLAIDIMKKARTSSNRLIQNYAENLVYNLRDTGISYAGLTSN